MYILHELHHHIKNMINCYKSAQQMVISNSQKHINNLDTACNSLHAVWDKQDFLQKEASLFEEPEKFPILTNDEFKSTPEVSSIKALCWENKIEMMAISYF